MPTKARGAIARTPGAPCSIEEFTIDDPGPNEVLVRILASGVCHTDLGVKMGVYGSSGYPFLLGHEGAGVIEKVGPSINQAVKHKVGDHVILAWRAPCGECRFCKRGMPNFCCASLNAEKRMKTQDDKRSTLCWALALSVRTRLFMPTRRLAMIPACPRPRCR